MRTVEVWNSDWLFVPARLPIGEAGELARRHGTPVTLPHTWNAADGQDGGGDYRRGPGTYVKHFTATPEPGQETWLEIRGANSSAEVWLNGTLVARHDGGYSAFRANLTPALARYNELAVVADNSPSATVYPQWADFTFYGGLYRDVVVLTLPAAHFALDRWGGPGVTADVTAEGTDARVALRAETTGGAAVRFEVEGVAVAIATVEAGAAAADIVIPQARRWHGLKDPHLYALTAALLDGDGQTLDSVRLRFGVRTVAADPERGFLLNGEPYPLRGVSRHQDWEGLGNAIGADQMETDLALIRELGANAVRLAHYQHDQYFLDRCDELGLVVWAEIPQISGLLPGGYANAESQMRELVAQNRHHAAVACWALSNEITVTGQTPQTLSDHAKLNDLVHSLDPSRLTAMAHFFLLDPADPLVALPDASGYNLYYGWYVGAPEDNDSWLAEFHAAHPGVALGLTEYGADANPAVQTGRPRQGDYSEAYQARYHDHMIDLIERTGWLWAAFVWNLADFGADARAEGGRPGRNQKGLVTFDRSLKKDAFYAYKAAWSAEPFVHVAGRRYEDRTEALSDVAVYSNQPAVALYLDGRLVAEQSGRRVFRFQVELTGEHEITASAGGLSDTIRVRKVDAPNPAYAIDTKPVANWVDGLAPAAPEGFYSIHDTLGDIRRSPEGSALVERVLAQAMAARGDMAAHVEMTPAMIQMTERQTVASLLAMGGEGVGPDEVGQLNQALNLIPKAAS